MILLTPPSKYILYIYIDLTFMGGVKSIIFKKMIFFSKIFNKSLIMYYYIYKLNHNYMNTSIVKEAMRYDIAIALSSTRWKILFNLPTRLSLSKYSTYFLKDIKDSFYLIQFVHATMVTLTGQLEDCIDFEFFGKDYFKDEITNIFKLNTTEQYAPDYEFSQLLLQLVDKIYDYFTTPYTGDKELKQAFLNSSNIEDTLCELKPEYKSEEDKQILALMQVVINQGEETLSAFEDLTVDANWKHIILSHYNFEAVEYHSFLEAYPEIVQGAKDDEIKKLEAFNTELLRDEEQFEMPEGFVDLFDLEKLKEECLNDFFKRKRRISGSISKQNHKVAITIKNIETNEKYSFDSSDECAKFLNISKITMIRFKQGKTKLNNTWQVIDKQEYCNSSIL